MNVRGPLVVPLDGSELAEGVLSLAGDVAGALRTHLVLVSVWEEPGGGIPVSVSMEFGKRAQDHLQSYLEGIRDRLQQPQTHIIVRSGDPADTIAEAADEVGARMIVAATHGRSGVSRWLYGSTTNRLLREARVPVLAAGPDAMTRHAAHRGFRHVMVPLDGSELGELAIGVGVELAAAFGARLALVRALPSAAEAYPYAGPATFIPSLDAALEREAETYIRKRQASITAKIEVDRAVVRGPAAPALLSFVDEKQVDLVVMTTHARSGIARAALGSTAERMLHGTAPVLLLRPETLAAARPPSTSVAIAADGGAPPAAEHR